jgi:GAF domain-containing protein
MLQGQRDLATVGRLLLTELAPLVSAQQGAIYQMETDDGSALRLLSGYAYDGAEGHPLRVRLGQGLLGQCSLDKRRKLITDIPETAAPIGSSLFKVAPTNIIVLPILFESQVKAVIELASINAFTDLQVTFLDQLTTSIGIVLNSIEATMQTESLLTQSAAGRRAADPAASCGKPTTGRAEGAAAGGAKCRSRAHQEIELARRAVEESGEFTLTSNTSQIPRQMSHELRTPLNSY